jgi:hypothetical protein
LFGGDGAAGAEAAGLGAVMRKQKTSFLKKRSKKLLHRFVRLWRRHGRAKRFRSFFGYFFFKKSNCFLVLS